MGKKFPQNGERTPLLLQREEDDFNSTKFGLLVKDVKYALRTERNRNNLALVDTLQRMGIEHHFHEEIQSILQKEYEESACFIKYQTHNDVALCFRLLRQEGYHVSAGGNCLP